MLLNYLKIAVRNIARQKGYSFINIFGLAVGLTCAILIITYIQNELSYDKFNKNADQIYRVTREWFNNNGESSLHLARVAPPIGPLLKNDFPQIVKEEVRFLQDYSTYLEINNNPVIENKFYWAEQSVFKIFTIHFVEGDPETALKEPQSVVITQSAAKKYFGDVDPLGKTIKYEHEFDLKVTGVIQNVPENSHFHYDFLASFTTLYNPDIIGRKTLEHNWGSNNYITYLLLPKNFPIKELEDRIPAFMDEHILQQIHEEGSQLPERLPHNFTTLHFQKLTDIHLTSHLTTEIEPNGDIDTVYLLGAVALFLLLIGCINFMNLATARSAKRSKEIGVRKVMGADKRQLVKQFLGESMVTVIISLFFSIIFVELSIRPFSHFMDRDLYFNLTGNLPLAAIVLVITLFVGLAAGIYPAFVLSSFNPVKSLHDNQLFRRKSTLRSALVVLQFVISITLLISMGVVYLQMQFVQNKNLGYNKDHLIILPSSGKIKDNLDSFKSQLLQNSNVKMVATSRLVPSNMLLNSWGGRVYQDGKYEPLSFRLAVQEVDYDFINTYQLKMLAGREFSKQFATDDSAAFILNESAVRKIGWKNDEAIGKRMNYGGNDGRVIGVVNDFNFETLHNEIVPIIFLITKTGNNQVTVRISGKDIPLTLSYLKQKWAEYRPGYPFDYEFLNQKLNSLYRNDQKLGSAFGIFALIAVIIACLGLFGLASYTSEVRTKEIGVRKVLGASVSNIVFLMSREFMWLIIIANIVAWPIAYYAMSKWLGEFAYATGINIWLFISAGALALLIAIITVSYQSIKAAIQNPVKSLRYE
jgi:putative ABC transport system permease protein